MLASKKNEYKHLEEKCAQSEKGYEDVNREYKDIKTQIQILNQKIANEEASQRDLEKQLASIHVQQKELLLKIDSAKEMQISEILDKETSDSLKNKMAEKEKHLVQLQEEVKAHEKDISSKKIQKETLEVKMEILHYRIKSRNILEILAHEKEQHINLLEYNLDANKKYIDDNKPRMVILEYKRKDLGLLRSIYLREEFKDQEEHQIEEDQLVLEAKIAEKEKEIVEKERHLAEHQKKVANTQKDIQNQRKTSKI